MDSRMFRTFPGWFEIVARKLYCEANRSLHASRTSKCSRMPPRRPGCSPVPAVIVRIKALYDGDAILDEEQGREPRDSLIKAARWFQLEESAHWNQKLAVALRDSRHYTEAIAYFERALELEPNLLEVTSIEGTNTVTINASFCIILENLS
jgi:tetratricopeptide (TPR) repeat protein